MLKVDSTCMAHCQITPLGMLWMLCLDQPIVFSYQVAQHYLVSKYAIHQYHHKLSVYFY